MAIQTLTLNADGAITTGWRAEAGDYTRLQTDDGDTTRLYSPTNGDIATFALTDTSGLASATINSVTIYGKFRSLDPVSNTFQLGVRISGTNYWSANKDTVNVTTYVLFSNTWTTNPATSGAWTTTVIDALESGMQKSNAVGGAMTYMYAEVDYTLGASFIAPRMKPIMQAVNRAAVF